MEDRYAVRVISVVAVVHNMRVSDIYSEKKWPSIVRARGIAAYMLRQAGYSYPAVARALHRDEHTGMMHAAKTMALAVSRGESWAIQAIVKVTELLGASEPTENDLLAITAANIADVKISSVQRISDVRINSLHRIVLDLQEEMDNLKALLHKSIKGDK